MPPALTAAERQARRKAKIKSRPAEYEAWKAKRAAESRRKRQERAVGKHPVPLRKVEGQGTRDPAGWELVTEARQWCNADGSLALEYHPKFYTTAENADTVALIKEYIEPNLAARQPSSILRFGTKMASLNISIQSEPGASPCGSLRAIPECHLGTQDKRTALALYMHGLQEKGILRKVNRLVRATIGPALYQAACDLVRWTIAEPSTISKHLINLGERPFSGLNTVLNSGSNAQNDGSDQRSVPSVYARFGSINDQDTDESDLFILPDHGLSISFAPGDVIIGHLTKIKHQVNLSRIPGDRMTLVHFLSQDLMREAARQGVDCSILL